MALLFRVLESLERFQDSVILSENDTTNQTTFSRETFAIQIQNIDPKTYRGHSFSVDLGSVEDALNITEQIPEESLITSETLMEALTTATASVLLPEDLLNNENSCNNETSLAFASTPRRLSHSLFLSDVLFQSEEQNQLMLGSIIISARTRCIGTNTTLNSPVTVNFRTNSMVYV